MSSPNSIKRRIYYTAALDIQLLSEVLDRNPWRRRKGWVELAAFLRTEPGFLGVEAKSLRDRTALLLSRFRTDDMISLQKSGTEKEYAEREQLLQEVSDLEEEGKRLPERRVATNAAGGTKAKAARTAPRSTAANTADDNSLSDEEEQSSPPDAITAMLLAAKSQIVSQEPLLSPTTDLDRKLREKELALKEQELNLRREDQIHRHEMERKSQEMAQRKQELEAEERKREREEIQKTREDFRDLMNQQILLMKAIVDSLTNK